MILKIIKYILRLKKIIFSAYYTWIVKYQSKSFGSSLRVNYKSRVSNQTILGNNVNFNGMTIKGKGQVIIGDNFHSGENCSIISEIHNYEGEAIPYDTSYILKNVIIEDNVWLGDNVIVLGEVTIGEGSIVQAGSVVVKDIPKYAIAGGHPAKVFAQRNIEHYEKLKERGNIH